MINLTTGPIEITKEVTVALSSKSISHRSSAFNLLYQSFTDFMCEKLNINQMVVMQGSGTLANESMIWQIKLLKTKGLVLSNGEFGNRLIDQATRLELDFLEYRVLQGSSFDYQEIETLVIVNDLKWLLFVNCETSTGVINNLSLLTKFTKKNKIDCFVDCMSTVGVDILDLSKVTMASCSSGKGLGSISGIAMVFSNIEFLCGENVPKYLDLAFYAKKKIPFTLSSNQLSALFVAVKQIMNGTYWAYTDDFSLTIYNAFNKFSVIPFSSQKTRVFTFVQEQKKSREICANLYERGLELSCQSEYLLNQNWVQLSLFGIHTERQIIKAIKLIKKQLLL